MNKKVIILEKDGNKEVWGSISEICREKEDIIYSSIKAKKFPFTYKGYTFIKLPFRKKLF